MWSYVIKIGNAQSSTYDENQMRTCLFQLRDVKFLFLQSFFSRLCSYIHAFIVLLKQMLMRWYKI